MNIDPNTPAFPNAPVNSPNHGLLTASAWGADTGLTIRAELAARIFAGMVSSAASAGVSAQMFHDYAPGNAVKLADALIAELNKPLA